MENDVQVSTGVEVVDQWVDEWITLNVLFFAFAWSLLSALSNPGGGFLPRILGGFIAGIPLIVLGKWVYRKVRR